MKACVEPGCQRKYLSSGLCGYHYHKQRRTGLKENRPEGTRVMYGVELPEAVYEELRAVSRTRDLPIAKVVLMAITDWLGGAPKSQYSEMDELPDDDEPTMSRSKYPEVRAEDFIRRSIDLGG